MSAKKHICRIMLILLFTVSACLSFSFAVNKAIMARAEYSFSEIDLKSEYCIGENLEIPRVSVTNGEQTYAAAHQLLYPNGVCKTDDSVVFEKSGKYKLVYKAFIEGRLYEKSYSFTVLDRLFTVQNEKSSAVYGSNPYLPEEVKGINLSLVSEDEFKFNKIIDISEYTKTDEIIRFYITPKTTGTREVQYINVKITDIYDPDNYIIITYKCLDTQNDAYNYSYTVAYANGQTPMGLEFLPNYNKAETSTIIKINGRFFHKHPADRFGFPARVSYHGIPEGSKQFIDNYQYFAMDYAERRVFCNYAWYKDTVFPNANMVIDLDDPLFHPDDMWTGFTTGEVALSVYGKDVYMPQFNLFITKIGDYDLSEENFIDDVSPAVSVDYMGYDENTVPPAVIGKPYKIFTATAIDNLDGNVPVDTLVYYNYYSDGRSLVNINNGSFTPDRSGIYTICYIAKDSQENIGLVLVDVEAGEREIPFRIELSGIQSQIIVAEESVVAEYAVFGNLGNVDINITARNSSTGETTAISAQDRRFQPFSVGTYEITYTARDHIESVSEFYTVTVVKTNAPILVGEPKLPKYLIKNGTYKFEDIAAYDYSDGTQKAAELRLFVCEDGASQEQALNNGNYTVNAAQKVKLIYRAVTPLETSEKTYLLPVVDVNMGVIDGTDYSRFFQGENFVSTSTKNNITYEYTGSESEAALHFINPILNNDFLLGFSYVEGSDNFDTIEILLTDENNPEIYLSITIKKYVDALVLSFNGVHSSGYTVQFDNENFSVQIGYIQKSKTLSVLTSVGSLFVPLKEDGAFNGFVSDFVYMTVRFKDVNGASAIAVNKVYNQSFSMSGYDLVPPIIYNKEKPANMFEKGEVAILYNPIVYDVTDINVNKRFYVITPSGEYAVSVDGIRLDGTNSADRNYSLLLTEYGNYKVFYEVEDFTFNSASYQYIIMVKDMVAPQVELAEQVETEIKVGKTVKVAEISVTETSGYSVTCFVKNPSSVISEVENGSFIADRTGVYVVYYYVIDDSGNLTIFRYELYAS